MGHVPPRPFSLFGEGADVPRREHRGSRPTGHPDLRIAVGSLGETLAADFLARHGLKILARNIEVGRGEVDILAADGSIRLVVEVRTLTGSRYPLDAVDDAKRRQVRQLAGMIRVGRGDLVGVGLFADHHVIHWEQDAF